MSTGTSIFLTVLLLISSFVGLGLLASNNSQLSSEASLLRSQVAELEKYLATEKTVSAEYLSEIDRLNMELVQTQHEAKSQINYLQNELVIAQMAADNGCQQQTNSTDKVFISSDIFFGSIGFVTIGSYKIRSRKKGFHHNQKKNDNIQLNIDRKQLNKYITWLRGQNQQ